ncbi:MAG TPA: DNA repair protein RadC [Oscillatoriaceae cyanobacterium]
MTRVALRIKDLPAAGRPRERMLASGPRALTESELVAILLGTGDGERSALGLAEQLLAHFAEPEDATGLRGLAATPPEELLAVPGVGPAKAARLLAALELGARRSALGSAEHPIVSSPQDAFRLLAPRFAGLDREHFVAILLDSKHQVLGLELVAIGSLNATIVHPRELFKSAIRKSAAALLLAHNHPSGDPTASREDLALTRQLMEGSAILGMKILDHLVVGDGRYESLRETSGLWTEFPFHQ